MLELTSTRSPSCLFQFSTRGGWVSNPGGGASRDWAGAGDGAAAPSALAAPAATVVVAMKSRRLSLC